MFNLTRYKQLKRIDGDLFAEYYRGADLTDNQIILIQEISENSFSTLYHYEQLSEEVKWIADINNSCLIKPIRLEKKGILVLPIYGMFNGISLKRRIHEKGFSLKVFFKYAIQLCSILEDVHDKDYMFLHLNPHNFFVDLDNDRLIILGLFNSLTKGKTGKSIPLNIEIPAWQVTYISPELTGRMNIHADFRANLYTLGIILYEWLTNQLPFSSADLSETLHAHFTRLPNSPADIHPEIPEILSTIILRLLEKPPGLRYQSASSLREDLEQCYQQYLKMGTIESFPLRLNEMNVKRRMKELVGRDSEYRILLERLKNTLSGHQESAFISGPSGCGKTALVHHLHNSNIGNKVIYLEGKFDQLQKNIPYAPIIQAFKTWIRMILAKGEIEQSLWKEKILSSLGPFSGALSFLLPEIEWIIGKQPKMEQLSSIESHSHFLIMFHKLVLLIGEEKPLLLFIDDIQWADAASLDLIEYLVTNVQSKGIFFIVAYRDGSDLLENSHADLTLKKIKETNIVNTMISLQPLEKEQVKVWVCEQYKIDERSGEQLSSIIYKITQGNPFFITQIFRSLLREKLILSSGQTGKVNLDVFKDLSISENVISYVVIRTKQLPLDMQEILKTASCFGREINVNKLAFVVGMDRQIIISHLLKAVSEGFLLPSTTTNRHEENEQFMFIHDRVQQALYSLLSDDEKQENHYKIGRFLKNSGNIRLDNEDLFDAVAHLNFCKRLLLDKERGELAYLNALAGEEAKRAAAFQSAYQYFLQAKQLLEVDSWRINYPLTFQIMKGLGEAAYLNSNFDEAENAFNEVLEKAFTREEKLKLYNLKITLYTHLHRVNEAVEAGLKGLQLFDWKINVNPGKVDIAREFFLVQLSLRDTSPAMLLDLPEMKDEMKRLLMQTLININAPAFHVNQNLATYLMLKAFRFTLKHGQTDITSLVFNNFSLIQSAGFGNYTKSYEYGNLAIAHVELSNQINLKARVFFVFATFVNHWKNPINGNLFFLQESQKYSVESGNIHLAGAASSFIIMTLLLKGERLEEVLIGVNKQLEFVKSINYRLSVDFINEMNHWLDVLMSTNINPIFDLPISNSDQSGDLIHYTLRLQMAYLMREEHQAKLLLDKLTGLVKKTNVLVISPDYYFYHTLWLSRFYENSTSNEKKYYKHIMKKNVKKMKKWAKNSPANYQHKYHLMVAELLKVLEKSKEEVVAHYENAALLALENGYLQDAAIAYECTSSYYIRAGYIQLGRYFLKKTSEQYLIWGAVRIAEHLNLQFPELVEKSTEKTMKGLNIDANAIVRSAQAISKEIQFEELIVTMMTIILENAGAERGYLFLMQEDRLELAIKRDLDRSFVPEHPCPVNELGDEIPLRLIRYISKTMEAVVLEDASTNGLFTEDPYIKLNKPKSVLSCPISYQNQLIGLLYLENNLITHAFTKERIQILSMLSSQAAISIENAKLYATLEEKVKERTSDLEFAISSLADANKQLENEEMNRRDLLSNISHDLRTPITSIQGYIESIIDGIVDTPDKQLIYLKRSKERIQSLNRLIQDLFDLSQLTGGKINFSKENVAADKLFQHLCTQYEWDITKHDLDFIVTIPDQKLFPLVHVDIGRIDQVFSNLISNALKYTKAGKIHLQLIAEIEADHVIFAVHDSGSGIEPEELETIFARSYTKRGEATKEGHGLGLAISKEIIANHGGRIWAESEIGNGTSIYFTLPAVKLEEDVLVI